MSQYSTKENHRLKKRLILCSRKIVSSFLSHFDHLCGPCLFNIIFTFYYIVIMLYYCSIIPFYYDNICTSYRPITVTSTLSISPNPSLMP